MDNKENIQSILKSMILALDDESGVNSQMYYAITDLTVMAFGQAASEYLSHVMHATEGRFYLPVGKGISVWEEIRHS